MFVKYIGNFSIGVVNYVEVGVIKVIVVGGVIVVI